MCHGGTRLGSVEVLDQRFRGTAPPQEQGQAAWGSPPARAVAHDTASLPSPAPHSPRHRATGNAANIIAANMSSWPSCQSWSGPPCQRGYPARRYSWRQPSSGPDARPLRPYSSSPHARSHFSDRPRRSSQWRGHGAGRLRVSGASGARWAYRRACNSHSGRRPARRHRSRPVCATPACATRHSRR